jgi:hypothetical protein
MSRALVALGPLWAAVCAASAAGQSAPDERLMQAAFITAARIETVVGPVDRHCGIFLLESRPVTGDAWPVAATRRQMQDGLRCILDARKAGRSSWVLWQRPAIDATSFGGFAISAVSDPQVVSASIGGVGRNATFTPCLRPRIDKRGEVLCRNTLPARSGRDLDRFLNRLRRDVTLTAGEAHTGTVAQVEETAAREAARSDPGYLSLIVDRVQLSLHADVDRHWPACPRHHDHPLEVRDERWFCGRDRVFLALVGDLTKAGVPRAPRR